MKREVVKREVVKREVVNSSSTLVFRIENLSGHSCWLLCGCVQNRPYVDRTEVSWGRLSSNELNNYCYATLGYATYRLVCRVHSAQQGGNAFDGMTVFNVMLMLWVKSHWKLAQLIRETCWG